MSEYDQDQIRSCVHRIESTLADWHPSQREYFAAAALTGLITLATDRSAQEYAADCAKMADALIRELEEKPQ